MMDRWLKSMVIACLMVAITPGSFAAKQLAKNINSPVGYWKTIDDVTGKPKALLQVLKANDQTLYGRILKTFPEKKSGPVEVCSKCKGERHNRPIVGMIVMDNLKQNGSDMDQWTGGKILDPKSGKTYHCNVKVVENGQKLNVRGYIGLPLFGRSQVWLRVTSPNKV